ncbi:hypothetical protein EST38_g11411 [Candolleomyces aberdarensis]|uniref:Uncharacterized protein n=1 Tax=Candolleomyces aberdarensis TaxID=2316362 RepID=A0A4Q2D795_9AGAR|nr:hypothetical protein EST38_g11411 [Candolleomyces aberdarensis]
MERPDLSERPSLEKRVSTAIDSTNEEGPVERGTSARPQRHGPLKTLWIKVLFPVAIIVVNLWPWILFGTLSTTGGIPLSPRLAAFAVGYPQQLHSLVTFISTLNRLAIVYLFGCAIQRYGKSLLARRPLSAFEVSALFGFKNLILPEEISHCRASAKSKGIVRGLLMISILLSILLLVGTAVLITPTNFKKTVLLQGTELNFVSEDDGCLQWLRANQIRDVCDSKSYGGKQYSTCLAGREIFNVLDSGLRNILARTNTSPPRGVLPQGPKGILGFDTVRASENPFSDPFILANKDVKPVIDNPFSDPNLGKGTVSYNYTLQLQGLHTSVKCVYDARSPIGELIPGASSMLARYGGTCDPDIGPEPALNEIQDYVTLNTSKTLSYWACKGPLQGIDSDPVRFIYLRGWADYESAVGNITCTVSQMRPAIFSVTYESSPGRFKAEKGEGFDLSSPSQIPYPRFIDHTLVGLGNVVREAQSLHSNLVAESVIATGVNLLNLPRGERHEGYLSLYEAMIEGMLGYEAMYSRLIYSTLPNPPATCMRTVTGSASYIAIGWRIRKGWVQALILIPTIIMTLATLVIYLVITPRWADNEGLHDPTDVRLLLAASIDKDQKLKVQD